MKPKRKRKHQTDCRCAICQKSMGAFSQWTDENLAKHGWVVHAILDARTAMGGDFHTHGLAENFGHKDFQIVAPPWDLQWADLGIEEELT